MVYKSHASLLSLAASVAEPINLVSRQKGAFELSCENDTFKTNARTGLYPDCLSRKGLAFQTVIAEWSCIWANIQVYLNLPQLFMFGHDVLTGMSYISLACFFENNIIKLTFCGWFGICVGLLWCFIVLQH